MGQNNTQPNNKSCACNDVCSNGTAVQKLESQTKSETFRWPQPQYFSKSTAVQMGDVLPCKWEAYCSTNGRRIAGFPFLRSLEARKVLPHKWGVYCRTNWRCTAVLSPRPVGVGVSETLPTKTQTYSRADPKNPNQIAQKRNPNWGLGASEQKKT